MDSPALGMRTVTWDVDSLDWNGANSLQNGGIMLMHDGYITTNTAVPQIVNNLKSRGLCAGKISPTTGRAVAPETSDPDGDG
jgi:peptidoglycan/xylan/chitin deacetylase (PgdA/CDA1 family)